MHSQASGNSCSGLSPLFIFIYNSTILLPLTIPLEIRALIINFRRMKIFHYINMNWVQKAVPLSDTFTLQRMIQ